MKKYIVTATAPATAEIAVSAECREEAIDKAGSMIDKGRALNFTVDILDADDVELSVREITPAVKGTASGAPELKPYLVALEATYVKEVPIRAVSPEAAEELVRQMYLNSDSLDFADVDAESIVATATPEKNSDRCALRGLLDDILGEAGRDIKPNTAS